TLCFVFTSVGHFSGTSSKPREHGIPDDGDGSAHVEKAPWRPDAQPACGLRPAVASRVCQRRGTLAPSRSRASPYLLLGRLFRDASPPAETDIHGLAESRARVCHS